MRSYVNGLCNDFRIDHDYATWRAIQVDLIFPLCLLIKTRSYVYTRRARLGAKTRIELHTLEKNI